MLKILILGAFMFLLLFLVPTSAHAQESSDNTLRHAYRPYTAVGRNTMVARINNHSTVAQKRLVCVEAFNKVGRAKTHLGCLWVDLAPTNSTGMWAMEFEAPTNMLATGSYDVVYTFQSSDGSWNYIKSVTMQVTDGMYVAP